MKRVLILGFDEPLTTRLCSELSRRNITVLRATRLVDAGDLARFNRHDLAVIDVDPVAAQGGLGQLLGREA